MKYVPGPAFGQFSGSQGNTTASHNKFGSYLRNRVVGADPNTSKQATQRALIASLSDVWKSLTDIQRAGWSSLGDQMIRQDSQGQSYSLTPLQAYTSVNMNLDLIGSARVDDAPLYDPPTDVFTLGVAAAVTIPLLDITYDHTIAAGDFLMVNMSAGVSQGISFVPRSGYKFIDLIDSVDTSPHDVEALWQAIYGVQVTGSKIFARAWMINAAGFAGGEELADTIVAA